MEEPRTWALRENVLAPNEEGVISPAIIIGLDSSKNLVHVHFLGKSK
jgi:hypothetical protein